MNITCEVVTLSVNALNWFWFSPVKNGWLSKCPEKKIYENSIIAKGTFSSNISIFCHECYIESWYGSWATHRYNKLSKLTTTDTCYWNRMTVRTEWLWLSSKNTKEMRFKYCTYCHTFCVHYLLFYVQ